MALTAEQQAYNQSDVIDWNIFYSSLSEETVTSMLGALDGTGINGETSVWENSGNLLGYVGKTYDDLYNQFSEHLAYGDLSELLLAIKSDLDSKGEVIVDGKKLNIASFNTPDTTDLSDFFATPADQFDPLQYKFETPQSIALLHFSRNLIMKDQNVSYFDLIKNADQFSRIADAKNEFHKLDNNNLDISGNENNIKWTSTDGLSEYIFKSDFSSVDDVVNAGSYNFFAPTTGTDGYNHLQLDVFTWIAFGNLYGDTTTVFDRGYDGVKSNLPDRYDTWLPFDFSDSDSDQNHALVYAENARFHILSGSGDDFFLSGSQDDHFDGGLGSDTVSYELSDSGISVNLRLGQGYDGYAAYDDYFEQLTSIENIVGSEHNDVIVGSTSGNTLEGMSGDDSIAGGIGNDVLDGGNGNDLLEGGHGNDILHGGEGSDTAIYYGNFSDYSVSVNADGNIEVVSTNQSDMGTDVLSGIETLFFEGSQSEVSSIPFNNGSSPVYWGGDFWISGDEGDNYTTVGDGNDTVWGYGGNDQIIISRGGNTQAYGGTGNDRFIVDAPDRTFYSGNTQATIFGEDGNDHVQVRGADTVIHFDGGDGHDTANLDRSTQTVGETFNLSSPEGISLQDGTRLVNVEEFTNLRSGSGDDTYIRMMAEDGEQHVWDAGAGFDTFVLDASNFDHVGTGSLGLSFNGQWVLARTAPGGTWEPSRIQLFNVESYHLTLSAGDDVVRTAGHDDIIRAGSGADEIFSEGGNDTIEGGSGNDTIDAGDGVDTVIFSGRYSEYSVTVNGVGDYTVVSERLEDTGTDHLQNVEIIEFTDGTLTAEGFTPVTTQNTVMDTDGSKPWESYTDTFDFEGVRISQSRIYDDGRESLTSYTDGVRTFRTITDAESVHTWTRVDKIFDHQGTLTEQRTSYDDGRSRVVSFSDGVRSETHMEDEGNAYSWSSYSERYDAEGTRTSRSMLYDDGRILDVSFTNGNRNNSLLTDASDEFIWSTIEKSYLSDGITLEHQTKIYDDGRELVTSFTDGIRSQSVMTDIDDVKRWDYFTIEFDAEGNKISRTMVFDDGHEIVTSYLDDFALV